MSDHRPFDYKCPDGLTDEEIKELKKKEKSEDMRNWTDEEIEDLKRDTEKGNALNLMAQMSVQDTLTIFKMDGEIRFWRRLFLVGLTVFLIIEIIWITLWLLTMTDIAYVIWNFIDVIITDIANGIRNFIDNLSYIIFGEID